MPASSIHNVDQNTDFDQEMSTACASRKSSVVVDLHCTNEWEAEDDAIVWKYTICDASVQAGIYIAILLGVNDNLHRPLKSREAGQ